jgi:hypothetical protein
MRLLLPRTRLALLCLPLVLGACTPVDDDAGKPALDAGALPDADAAGDDPADREADASGEDGALDDGASGDTHDELDQGPAPNRPPELLELSASRSRLVPGDSLTVVALVSDPDGPDDVLGGTLRHERTGVTLGAFARQGVGGYSLSLAWDELVVVLPPQTGVDGATERLRARFVDTAQHVLEGELVLTFDCGDERDSLCAGVCADLETSAAHCGACDAPVSPDHACQDGAPICSSAQLTDCGTHCSNLHEFEACGSCANDCAELVADGDMPLATFRPFETGYRWVMPFTCHAQACYLVLVNDTDRLTPCATFCERHGLVCRQFIGFDDGVVAWAWYDDSRSAYVWSCDDVAFDPHDGGERWRSTNCACGQVL